MTTQNRHHKDHTNTGQIADTWQGASYAAAGSYTDVDTLARGGARHAARPGSYTDTDILTHPKTDAASRPGSYVDVDTASRWILDVRRPGSYTDIDLGGH